MANIIVSGSGNSFVNGEYIDQENNTWRKNVSIEDDAQGYIDIFFFNPTNLWYLQGSSVYSSASGGTEESDPTTLSWSSGVSLAFDLPLITPTPSPTPQPLPLSPIEERNAKYATLDEDGEKRFRRLFGLGYV